MDKITLTNHIRDIDLKNKMYKVIDKANTCLKNYDIRETDFLNPYEIKNAIGILNSFSDIKYFWQKVMPSISIARPYFLMKSLRALLSSFVKPSNVSTVVGIS